VNLTATADKYWYFVNWTGDATGTNTTLNITMDSDKSITAVFEANKYNLTVNIEGDGTVEDHEEFEFTDGETKNYIKMTEVNLTAIVDEHWYFVNWTGDVTSTNTTLNITMDSNKTINATFEQNTYTLNITTEGEGTVDIDPDMEEYEPNAEVNLTAIADKYWYFVNWTGDYESEEEEINIAMDDDKTLTANFEELDKYNLTIEIEGEGTTDPVEGNHTYYDGEVVVIEAIPDEGWYFEEWTGDYTGTEEEINITMDDNKTLTAVFEAYEPYFEVEITDYDEQVREGEYVTVKYTVVNTGEVEGTQDIVFLVEGSEEDRKEDVTLEVGQEQSGEFFWTAEEGSYLISVSSEDDQDTEGVTASEELDSSMPGFTTMLLVLASVIAVAIYRKKKR